MYIHVCTESAIYKNSRQSLSGISSLLSPSPLFYTHTEIMVDHQLTETSEELAQAKEILEQKDCLIQQLRDQINQMDYEIQQLQTTMTHISTRTQTSTSPELDKDDSSWYL